MNAAAEYRLRCDHVVSRHKLAHDVLIPCHDGSRTLYVLVAPECRQDLVRWSTALKHVSGGPVIVRNVSIDKLAVSCQCSAIPPVAEWLAEQPAVLWVEFHYPKRTHNKNLR